MNPEELGVAPIGAVPPFASESEIVIRVRKWMESHGVGLEMKVAGAFRKKLGFGRFMSSVDHSRNYNGLDHSSGTYKTRETDVVVRLTKSLYGNIWITTWLILECKSSKDSPWVLFYDSAQPSVIRSDPLPYLWDLKHLEDMFSSSILGAGQSPLLAGYGVGTCYSVATAKDTDSKGNQKNDARDSVLQVLSAVKGVGEDAVLSDTHRQLNIFIPIIITSAPISTITLLMDGTYEVGEAGKGLFLGSLDSKPEIPRGVWIVRESELEMFVDEIIEQIQDLDYRTH